MAKKRKGDTKPKGHKHWRPEDIATIMDSLSPKRHSDHQQCRSDKVLNNNNKHCAY